MMLCYKDRAYCPFKHCPKHCDMKITEEIEKDALRKGMPIQYIDKFACFKDAMSVLNQQDE